MTNTNNSKTKSAKSANTTTNEKLFNKLFAMVNPNKFPSDNLGRPLTDAQMSILLRQKQKAEAALDCAKHQLQADREVRNERFVINLLRAFKLAEVSSEHQLAIIDILPILNEEGYVYRGVKTVNPYHFVFKLVGGSGDATIDIKPRRITIEFNDGAIELDRVVGNHCESGGRYVEGMNEWCESHSVVRWSYAELQKNND